MKNNSLRVLVIDDDDLVRESIVDLLQFLGHAVDDASNGFDGVAKFRSTRHDAVITDLKMPGLDGWAVVAELRTVDPEVRVVLCTGSATNAVIDRARTEAVPVLAKPMRVGELQAVLRPRLRGSSGLQSSIVRHVLSRAPRPRRLSALTVECAR